jgi:hypothetical protein
MSHQAPFYFYGADSSSKSDPRLGAGAYAHQLGFQQLAMYQAMAPSMPSTPVYTRPSSSCSQPPVTTAPTLYSNGPSIMTPMASPRPVAHKPLMMLDTDFSDCASPYLPSTPPLSSCGGSIGSPSEMLQTPMNPMFSGLDGLRHDFDVVDNLSLDWSVCTSPPMTPVYLQSQPVHKFAPISRSSTDLSATSCPSLSQSPSPSPYTRSASLEPNTSFCDPRNLTVTSVAASSSVPSEFIISTPCDGLPLSPDTIAISAPSQPPQQPQQQQQQQHSLPEIDGEEDFSVVAAFNDQTSSDVRRPRAETGSSVVSLGHGSFISEQEVASEECISFAGFPSPPSSCSEDDSADHPSKRVRISSCVASPAMSVSDDSQLAIEQHLEDVAQSAQLQIADETSTASSTSEAPLPLPAPANRRGRKQSLTEDPSKTFVCDVCHRRFRRQEHLKRHYRSLHTTEKPFECGECGKKFSRSDNLAQHARTHGSGAIVMDLLEDGTIHSFDPNMLTANFAQLGQAMYSLATQAPGSSESDSGSDSGKKKRKRSD